MKCQACKQEEAEWAWQPFGPGSDANVFALLGNHTRGFPIIKVGDSCKNGFQRDHFPVRFEYKGHKYITEQYQVREIGASLWLGEECVPSELNDAPAIYINRDTAAKGIDVAAIVYMDNADLIPAILSSPQLAEVCEELLELYKEKVFERHLRYDYYSTTFREEHERIMWALAHLSNTMDILHANQEPKVHA